LKVENPRDVVAIQPLTRTGMSKDPGYAD